MKNQTDCDSAVLEALRGVTQIVGEYRQRVMTGRLTGDLIPGDCKPYFAALKIIEQPAAFYCPRGYGECQDARACVYPGRCGRAEQADQAVESEHDWRMGL